MNFLSSINKLFIYALVAFSAIKEVFTAPIRDERSTTSSLDSPCFILEQEGSTLAEPFKDSILRLKGQVADLKLEVQKVKAAIKTRYLITDLNASYLDLKNFTNREKMLAGDEQRAAAINQPIQALKGSYSLLQELVYFVDFIRKNGKIGTSTLEATTRDQIIQIEERLYSCLCSVKIALLSNHTDVVSNVTSDVLSYDFRVTWQKPKEYETYRAYIVMGDNDRLMEFLSIIYSDIYLATV